MHGYDLLKGVTVLEVAQLGPDALGGQLADMGAHVIKVEAPEAGDPIRFTGEYAVGDDEGVGFFHLRWNRGKHGIAIDLRHAEGRALFERLAATADVVIDGMRGGALDRLGIGYDALSRINPRLVFCSLSGFGLDGAYHALGSHGPAYDAYGGLMPAAPEYRAGEGPKPVSVAMYAMGLYAAIGVLAAVIRARKTGQGAMIEVAAADIAVAWYTDSIDVALNPGVAVPRAGFTDDRGQMFNWPRITQYAAKDGKILFFQGFKDKFWKAFCTAVDRPDLAAMAVEDGDVTGYHERVWTALQALFRTRDRADWIALFLAHGIPGHPLNSPEDLVDDPHFRDRALTYRATAPNGEALTLFGTPIRLHGQDFAPRPAPALAQDSDEILRAAGLPDERIAELRAAGAVR